MRITTDGEGERSAKTNGWPGILEILDALPFYAMLVDADHHILLANKAVSRDLAVDPEQIVGRYCPKVVHGLDGPFPGCPLEEAVEKGHAVERELFDPASGGWLATAIYPTTYRTQDDRAIFLHMARDITERKRAEEALRESREKYRTILENIEDGYYEVDIAGNLTFFNDALCRIFGYPEDELMGMNNRQYMDEETAKAVYQTFNAVYRTGKPTKIFDYEIIRKDGTRRFVEASVSLISGSTGEPVGFRGIIRDITERKRAEEALRESERKYSELVQQAPDAIVTLDKLGSIETVNPATERLTGYTAKELIGKNFAKIGTLSVQSVPKALKEFASVLTGKERPPSEWDIVRKDKTHRRVEAKTRLMKHEGKITGVQVILRDITERKRAEEALRKSEESFNRMVTSVEDVLYSVDGETREFSYVSPAFERLLGYRLEDVREMGGRQAFLSQVIERGKFAEQEDTFEQLLSGEVEETPGWEGWWRCKDGSLICLEDRWRPIYDGERLVSTDGVLRDITERKRAEEELRRRNEFVTNTLESLNHPFYVIDVNDYKVKIANSAVRRGNLSENTTCYALTHKRSKPCGGAGQLCPLEEVKKTKEPITVEHIHYDKDGNARNVEVHAHPIFDAEGSVVQVIEYCLDITERKRAEEALKNAAVETLEALSRLVEAKDPYTSGHSAAVSGIAIKIAEEMGLGEDQLDSLQVAGLLHDLGKVGIPGSVLNKPARLTQAEWMMIQAHPIVSGEIADRVAAFKHAVPIIRHHHERWDGTGYPDGLKGEDIPLLARILAVADGFEAMTSERPYRRALTEEEALAELQKGAGSQWDPQAVEVLVKIYEEGAWLEASRIPYRSSVPQDEESGIIY